MEQQQKEESKKTISLESAYWKIQMWLDIAGIGDIHHSISIDATGYGHRKKGLFQKEPTKVPEKSIAIHVGNSCVVASEPSYTIAMETTRLYIEGLKIQKESEKDIDEVTMETN